MKYFHDFPLINPIGVCNQRRNRTYVLKGPQGVDHVALKEIFLLVKDYNHYSASGGPQHLPEHLCANATKLSNNKVENNRIITYLY